MFLKQYIFVMKKILFAVALKCVNQQPQNTNTVYIAVYIETLSGCLQSSEMSEVYRIARIAFLYNSKYIINKCTGQFKF